MLRHSSDSEPGITRQLMGRHWAYFDPQGNRITDREEIDRLNGVGLRDQDAGLAASPRGLVRS